MFTRLLLLALLVPVSAFATELRILDVGPRTFDDAPALGVVFSAPLDAARRYEGVLIVEDNHSELVPGAWILSDNRRVMYFPAVQPEGEYRVWARKGLTGADGAVLAESVVAKDADAFGGDAFSRLQPVPGAEGVLVLFVADGGAPVFDVGVAYVAHVDHEDVEPVAPEHECRH